MANNGNDWRSGSPRGRRVPATKPDPAAAPTASRAPAKDRSDWRKKKIGDDDRAREEALKGKDYLRRRDQTHRERTFRHRLKVGLWTGAALLMVAVLIVILLFLPQRVTLVEIVISDYQAPMPPNSYAKEDGELLRELDAYNSRNIQVKSGMKLGSSPDAFISYFGTMLKELKPGGPDKNTFLIYLSAHGVVNEKNEPCLLLSSAKPLETDNWLPVSRIVKAIEDDKQLGDPNNVKVLILDSGRVDELWDAGILYNSFAESLANTIQAANLKNFYVLHSCSAGERNWSGPELSGSAFGRFVANGLAGHADMNRNGAISLQELHDYVRLYVNQWVRLHRGSPQNPQLIPAVKEGESIRLAYCWKDREQLPVTIDPFPAENVEPLAEVWKEHERLLTKVKPYRYDPVGWALLQENLVRLESLWLGGNAYQESFQALLAEIGNQMRELGSPRSLSEVAGVNLPLNEQLRGFEVVPGRIAALQQLMDLQASGGQHNIENGPKPAPDSYLEALYASWHWLLDPQREVTPARLTEARGMIEQTAPSSRAEPIEGHYLRMLHENLDWGHPGDSLASQLATVVRESLRARQLSETAVSPLDERVIYWIQQYVDDADVDRRKAEDHLFVGTKADIESAASLVKQAIGAESSENGNDAQGYLAAIAEAGRIADAYATRDLAWSDMRYFATWVLWRMREAHTNPNAGQDSAPLVDALHSLLKHGHELGTALENRENFDKFADSLDGLKTARQAIVDDHSRRVGELAYVSPVDANTVATVLDALQLPLYTGTHRQVLRGKLVEYLTQPASALTNEKEAEQRKALANLGPPKPADSGFLVALAQFGNHPALAMVDSESLGLPGVPGSTTPGFEPLSSSDAQSPVARQLASDVLAQQGGFLRDKLRGLNFAADGKGELDRLIAISYNNLREEYAKTAIACRIGYSGADRLCRAAGPLMSKALARSASGPNSPTSYLRRTDRYFQCLWLANRTLEDFWGPKLRQGRNYFEIVAEDLLNSRQQLLSQATFRRYQGDPLPEKLLALSNAAQRTVELRGSPISASPDVGESILIGSLQSNHEAPQGLAAIYATNYGRQVFPLRAESVDRRRFAYPVGPASQAQPINSTIVWNAGGSTQIPNTVKLRSFFRGHEGEAELPVESTDISSDTIVTHYPAIVPPEVVVLGENMQVPSVLFVFDCSATMEKKVSGEQTRIRINVARECLNEILEKNLPDETFRVGLMLYGHRAGWERGGFTKLRRNFDMIEADIDPNSLHPSIDVETVVPITMLNDRVRRDIARKLTRAKPWGQTPLYLSISEALKRFKTDRTPKDSARQIIVITDGENDPGEGTSKTSLLDVIKMRKEYPNTRIDVVAFDTNASPELTKLVEEFGGQVHSAKASSTLEQALDKLLKPVTYYVHQASDRTNYRDQARPLGETFHIDDWSLDAVESDPRAARYVATLFGLDQEPSNDDNLELLGGESLLMDYRGDGQANRLEHREYAPKEFGLGDRRVTELAPSNDDQFRKFEVKAFVPKRTGSQLQFDVSIQHYQHWPFTQRPKRIWIEIRPEGDQSGSAQSPKFNFYDNAVVQSMPVPVYRCTVQKWPTKSQRAEVRVWFLMQDLPPALTARLPVVDNEQTLDSAALRERFPDSSFQVKVVAPTESSPSYRAFVFQTVTDPEDLHSACVDVWPRPDKAEHIYRGNKVEHRFTYNRKDVTPELKIWSRAAIEAQSVRITNIENDPMIVRIPE